MRSGRDPVLGHWVEIERPPYVTDPVCCACCGVMIPRRYWDVGSGLTRPYCSVECVALERRVGRLAERHRVARNSFPSLSRVE